MSSEINDSTNEPRKTDIKAEILDWSKHIVIALVIAFILARFVIVNANVPTSSMEPTIMVNDRLIANRLSYNFTSPKRGDIVVFKYPDDENVLYVKRIIGLSGETVNITKGSVYINGEKLDEPYISTSIAGNFGPYTVPDGSYFMMGDNRNNSQDSRYWKNKYVSKDKILGKALFKYYPFQNFKLF
jgi:signal peptidase I, bacterial type